MLVTASKLSSGKSSFKAFPRRNEAFSTPSAAAFFSHSGRLKEAYSLPQRSMPTIFPCGLRFAQVMVSAPLPQPMSSPTPPSGSVICFAVSSMICFEILRSPS